VIARQEPYHKQVFLIKTYKPISKYLDTLPSTNFTLERPSKKTKQNKKNLLL
jgi:hypothetical protein